jgi:zinc D-Ala-D-Ala carboxypeptidase
MTTATRTMLSPHFSLEEMTDSDTAVRFGIRNEPDAEQLANLTALCMNVLEPARVALGPIRVSSGLRVPELNAAIGGSRTSQHMQGEAADVVPGGVGPVSLAMLFGWLFYHTPFDQLIWEFDRWIHVSHRRGGPQRHQLLRAFRRDGRVVYAPMPPPAA